MPRTFHFFASKAYWLFLVLPFVCAMAAGAQEPPNAPKTQYWVTDQARVLSGSIERSLTKDAEAFERQTSNQVVVVTVKSLDGWTVERYGLWLANKWRIGQAGKNNGVLLLVAPNERKVRIEVGLGLESTLTNAIAQSIIDDDILPKFRAGDLPMGIIAGHRAIIEALNGEYSGKPWWQELLQFLLLPFCMIGRVLGFGGGRFSGGGGSFGGGGASGSW